MLILYFIYLSFLIFIYIKKQKYACKKTIVPRHTPPPNLTAAQATFLCAYTRKKDILAISLIQMVMSGFLKLNFTPPNHIILKRTNKVALNTEEKNLDVPELCFKDSSERAMLALNKLEKTIKEETKNYYITNRIWIMIPTALILFFISLYYLSIQHFLLIFILILGCVYTSSIVFHFNFLNHFFKWFIITSIYLPIWMEDFDNFPIQIFFLINMTSSIFAFLLYKPTEKSTSFQNDLEGIKAFLKTDTIIHEKITQKDMKNLLPYAFALRLEKEWGLKFKQFLGKAKYVSFIKHHPYVLSREFHDFTYLVFEKNNRYKALGKIAFFARYFW